MSLELNLIYGAFGLLFALIWVFILDKFPRVRLLIVSSLFMAAAVLVQSVLSAVYNGGAVGSTNELRAQVAMFFIFNLSFVSVGYEFHLP